MSARPKQCRFARSCRQGANTSQIRRDAAHAARIPGQAPDRSNDPGGTGLPFWIIVVLGLFIWSNFHEQRFPTPDRVRGGLFRKMLYRSGCSATGALETGATGGAKLSINIRMLAL
jgi:hypothetical protein